MQPDKESRSTTSCTECQRRKQKCSREWPCNHCQARKVPHLCQFGQKKAQQASPPDSGREKIYDPKGRKRSLPESITDSSTPLSVQEEQEDGLKMWGYMPGHVHYALSQTNGEDPPPKKKLPEPSVADEVEKALSAMPPRSITDTFVNHFLNVVNYRYSTIYAPTFTEQYVQWWSDRANGRRLSPEFTSLLLRVLAHTVQYLTPSLRKMIEFEMACSSQALSDRFASAADQLSKNFSASTTCIERVQEQFLRGAWLKAESKLVESWHSLSRTIREAQELGVDKETGTEGLSEFDVEIRRRLWTLLFLWDWQISAWLGRPHLIDQKDISFIYPNLRLDKSSSHPNALSPFAHITLQASLARRIAPLMGDVQVNCRLSVDQVSSILAIMPTFIDELPPIFRMDNPDLSLDVEHPYYVFQRHQLHAVIYMTFLDFCKPYLVCDPKNRNSPKDVEFRETGIELSLKLLKVARRLVDHEWPINTKFHMVVFSFFDTATLLCSAIIHDVDQALPHREQIMDAIESCLDTLHQLSASTKIGAASYKFLLNLVQAIPVLARHSPISKRQKVQNAGANGSAIDKTTPSPSPHTFAAPTNLPTEQANTQIAQLSVPEIPTTEDLSFDLDQFLAQNPFDDQMPLDLGGIEAIWGWDNLHIDGFGRSDPNSQNGL